MVRNDEAGTQALRDVSRVTIRSIEAGDVELERRFIEELSPQARRFRFLCTMKTPGEALLRQLTDIVPVRDAALIAVIDEAGREREVGVARFSATPDGRAEMAVTVSDDWRHRGLATALMHRLINVARDRGLVALYSIDAAENQPMRELASYLGFTRRTNPEDATQVIHSLDLTPAPASP
ncbi:MAG TPA: GNAT family N-acetyltransferase [Steroidobacteraceae bacterium]|nr:GNAT family N-acetyltransferase [Steroidobacteraceae bacterium]